MIPRPVVAAAVRAAGVGRRYSTAAQVRRHTARLARHPASFAPPRWACRGVEVSRREDGGWVVYRLAARGAPATAPRVVFLHGGAYVYEITGWHWLFAARIAARAPAVVEIPIYPLAPGTTAAETVPAAARLIGAAVERARRAGAGPRALVGDSAGGGLALAASILLRDAGGPLPDRLVLVSPWLDVTMTDPAQPAIDLRDPLLGIDGLAEAGRCYAGGLDLRDPRVSPLFGALDGLPPVTVFSGTRDVLHPDARRFVERAAAAGIAVDHHDVDGGLHDYPLLPLADGRAAQAAVLRVLRG